MKIHFLGIGGIGVSALARYHLAKGDKVSGSDLISSETTEALKKAGAKISTGNRLSKNFLKNIDLVIYSPAVQPDNPDLEKAKKMKIKCLSYPQALGELTEKYFTIAISGTHGKSTVTSMIGLLLTRAGFDPTVIVGTKIKEFSDSTCLKKSRLTPDNFKGSNCRTGKSNYLVIEACEHMASFLNYRPKITVLTNIEADHLDYYKNFKNYFSAFKKFVSRLPKKGVLILNKDDKNSLKLKTQISKMKLKTENYTLKQPEALKLKKILKIPGEHNVSNALAALTLARILKIPDKISFKSLSEFKGIWRRFEIMKTDLPGRENKKLKKKIIIVSDYGHHPTEVKATLKAVREKWPKKEIWCIYQPHQYQRTYYFFDDFVKVFWQAQDKFFIDKLIITDIYDVAGREKKEIKKKLNSEKLIKEILFRQPSGFQKEMKLIYVKKDKIFSYLEKNLEGEEVIVIMGAGDIYDLTLALTNPSKKIE